MTAKPVKEWSDRLGEWIADRLDCWLLGVHKPTEVPNGTPWCKNCRASWPCGMFVSVDRRIADRT